jgi:hypothetical protein
MTSQTEHAEMVEEAREIMAAGRHPWPMLHR